MQNATQSLQGARFSTVSEYQMWDHGVLDDMWFRLATLVGDGRWDEAALLFEAVELRQLRHAEIEERLLFPLWEDRFGTGPGPTQVMRAEHAQMTGYLEAVREAVELQDADAFRRVHRGITSLATRHHAKEEAFLHPGIDRMLTADERWDLVQRMMSL